MTKREAAIIGAYTGVLCGSFHELHEYVEEILKRPVDIHDLRYIKKISNEVEEKAKADFLAIDIV